MLSRSLFASKLTLVDADDEHLTHRGVVGDTYTILINGTDTAGRYALIDMLIPPAGGPPPHRHDFEEMFHVIHGEIHATIRDHTSVARAGDTNNIPALAPHSFTNPTDSSGRLLCLVSPAGLEEYFAQFADPVASRTTPAPRLNEEQLTQRMQKAVALAPKYRIEVL